MDTVSSQVAPSPPTVFPCTSQTNTTYHRTPIFPRTKLLIPRRMFSAF